MDISSILEHPGSQVQTHRPPTRTRHAQVQKTKNLILKFAEDSQAWSEQAKGSLDQIQNVVEHQHTQHHDAPPLKALCGVFDH